MNHKHSAVTPIKEKVSSSTVVKAMHVLQSLEMLTRDQPDGAAVSLIAQHSGESASSVCKHLAAFQQFGLVEQDEQTERYRIGMYAVLLSSSVLKRINIRDIANPHLRKLAEETEETVHLVIRDGLRVVYVDKVESPRTIRMYSQIGLRNPLYCTGVGKAILAFSPIALTYLVIEEGMKQHTETTLFTKEMLLDDLRITMERGYAIDYGEHDPDVCCVAAPIFDHSGEVIASISVAGPLWRMNAQRIEQFGKRVGETTHAISQQMGSGLNATIHQS